MINSLILPVGILLDVVPFAFLCYFPFRDQLRISPVKLLALLLLPLSAEFLFYWFWQPMPYALEQVIFFIFLAIYFLFYFITIKMDFSKCLFIFFLNTNYAAIVVGVSNYSEIHAFSHFSHFGGYSLPLIGFFLAFLFVTIVPWYFMIIKKIQPLLKLENKKSWNKLWVIPLMFLFMQVAFAGADSDNLVRSWEYITVTLTMAVAGVVVYSVVIAMILGTYENATLNEHIRMVNLQMNLQKEAYQNLHKHIEDTRNARHDLRHHISMIQTFLQSGNMVDLEKYLGEYKSSLPDDKELLLCENTAANVIVLHYTQIARDEGINVSVSLQLPAKIGIADLDLCIVLGNCLENALEACRKLTENRYIKVRSRVNGNILGITIDNSYDGIIIERSGRFFSRKRADEEGIGLASVRAVAAKYDGSADFSYDDCEFRASIVLKTEVCTEN